MDLYKLAEQLNELSSEEWTKLSSILQDEFGIYLTGSSVKVENISDKVCVRLISIGNSKLGVCKTVKEYLKLPLKESKDLIDKAPVILSENLTKDEAEEFTKTLKELGADVSIEPIGSLGFYSAYPNAYIPTDDNIYGVHLINTGPAKLAVLKEIKEILDLDLRSAKELMDKAPVTIISDITLTRATEIRDKLRFIGAHAELT